MDECFSSCPPLQPGINQQEILDIAPGICDPCPEPSLRDQKRLPGKKYRLGSWMNCDPKTSGNFIPNPKSNLVYSYPQSIRALNEAMMDLFSNVILLDVNGNQIPVPIVWSSPERAVSFILQENIRTDNTGVVDRVNIPLMSLYANGFSQDMTRYTYHWVENIFRDRAGKPIIADPDNPSQDYIYGQSRGLPVNITYQLTIWTYYIEDLYQAVEQIFLKFSPIAYINTTGNAWQTAVKLDSASPNIDLDPGNTRQRLVKFDFNFTAEHYIAQPPSKYKPVKEVRIDITDGIGDRTVDIVSRIRETGEKCKN